MNEGFIEINPEELPARKPPVEESFSADDFILPEEKRLELKQLIQEIQEQEN